MNQHTETVLFMAFTVLLAAVFWIINYTSVYIVILALCIGAYGNTLINRKRVVSDTSDSEDKAEKSLSTYYVIRSFGLAMVVAYGLFVISKLIKF
jgi:hypothetical protein